MTECGTVSVCPLFGIWLLLLSLQGQQGVEKWRSPPLSPLVLPPLIWARRLSSPAKFAKSNFQLMRRSQQQAQRA